jgi:hypothetical protein
MRSNSIGDGGSINSGALREADGTSRKPDPNKGAGSIIGPYSHVPVSSKDPKVASREPPRKPASARVKQP